MSTLTTVLKQIQELFTVSPGLVYGAAQTVPTVSYAVVFAVGKHLVLDGTVPYGNLFM